MAIVHSVVQSHSGAIRVSSHPGKGSLFEILLPEYELEEGNLAQSNRQPLQGGEERILIVDDEEAVRSVVQRGLEHLGYSVEVAESGSQAIERFQDQPEMFSLIILDMMMPKMSGEEVFARLIEIDPDVRVLIASAFAGDGRIKGILDAGGLGMIQKPFAVEELAQAVRECLDAD